MAWQNSAGMGGSGGGSGGASDAGGSGAGQPQGTEYTLQGMGLCIGDVMRVFRLVGRLRRELISYRSHALPTDRVASPRARSKRLADRKSRNEVAHRKARRGWADEQAVAGVSG